MDNQTDRWTDISMKQIQRSHQAFLWTNTCIDRQLEKQTYISMGHNLHRDNNKKSAKHKNKNLRNYKMFRLRQVLAGSLHRPPPHSSFTQQQQQQLAAHQHHLHTHNSLHKQLLAAALIRAAIKSLQSLFMMLMEMQVTINY